MTRRGADHPTADRAPRQLLAVSSLGYGSTFLGLALVSPLLPAVGETLRLGPLEAGVALWLLWAVRALAQYPSGRLSDQVTRKTLLVGGLVSAIVGVAVLGAAPTVLAFLVGAAVLGLGNGLYAPAAIALVSVRFADRRGQALGVLIGTADLAGAMAGILAVGLAGRASWRLGFLIVAVILAGTAGLLHRADPDPYVRPRGLSLDVRATGRRLFGHPDVRWAIAGFALWMVAFQGTVSFLPTLLIEEKAVSMAVAGGGFALLWVVGAIAKPVVGRLGDRFGHLPVATGTLVISVGGLTGVTVADRPAIVLGSVLVFAAGLLGTTPLVWAYVADASPNAAVGGDVGALRTVFEGVGSLGPLGVGVVAGWSGYGRAFAGLVACLVAAAVLVGGLAVRTRSR